MPVAGEAGHAEEQGPGTDEPVIEGQARDDHVGAVPEQLAERHAAGSLRTGPAARMLLDARPPHAHRHRRHADRDVHRRRARRPPRRRSARARSARRARFAADSRPAQGLSRRRTGRSSAGRWWRPEARPPGTPTSTRTIWPSDRNRTRREGITLTPSTAHRASSARLPGRAPAGPPRLPGDRRRGQRTPGSAALLAGRYGPMLDSSGLAIAGRRGRRRDPDRRPRRPRPAVRGPVGDGAFPRSGPPRRRSRLCWNERCTLRPRTGPRRHGRQPSRAAYSGSASGSC